jgi:hypothetical protein
MDLVHAASATPTAHRSIALIYAHLALLAERSAAVATHVGAIAQLLTAVGSHDCAADSVVEVQTGAKQFLRAVELLMCATQ